MQFDMISKFLMIANNQKAKADDHMYTFKVALKIA